MANHYEVLGVSRTCDRETLHRTFRQLSKEYHPDRFPESERARAEKRYKQIVIAFNTLKDIKLKERYNKSLVAESKASKTVEDPETLAKKYFKTGLSRLSQGQYENAAECFKRAMHYHTDPDYHFQLGLAQLNIPKHQKEGILNIQRAISKNPRNLKYHQQLVKSLLGFGLTVRAKAALEKACRFFPNDPELMAYMEKINPQNQKKQGLLGGLFGK